MASGPDYATAMTSGNWGSPAVSSLSFEDYNTVQYSTVSPRVVLCGGMLWQDGAKVKRNNDLVQYRAVATAPLISGE